MGMVKINLEPFLRRKSLCGIKQKITASRHFLLENISAGVVKGRDIVKRFGMKLQSLARPKVFWSSIIILLILSTALYMLKEKEKSLRIYTEKELSKTIEAKKVVENNLTVAKKEISAKDEQISLTLNKLEREVTARRDVEAQLVLVTKEKIGLEAKVEELTAALPKNIELEKIVVKSTQELTGKVLSLDREHGFIVVDLGNDNNLKLGDVLSVYRDNQFIGKVQVEKIEEKSSAAVILSDWQNTEFKENDTVKRL